MNFSNIVISSIIERPGSSKLLVIPLDDKFNRQFILFGLIALILLIGLIHGMVTDLISDLRIKVNQLQRKVDYFLPDLEEWSRIEQYVPHNAGWAPRSVAFQKVMMSETSLFVKDREERNMIQETLNEIPVYTEPRKLQFDENKLYSADCIMEKIEELPVAELMNYRKYFNMIDPSRLRRFVSSMRQTKKYKNKAEYLSKTMRLQKKKVVYDSDSDTDNETTPSVLDSIQK